MKTTFRFFILLLALVPGCMLAGPPTNNPTANVRMVAVDTAGNLYGPSTNLFKKNLGLVQASGIFANGTNGVITAPAGSAGGSVDLGVGGNGGPTEDGQSNQSDGGAGGTVNLATGGAGGGGSDGNGGTVNLATTRFGAPGRVNAGYLYGFTAALGPIAEIGTVATASGLYSFASGEASVASGYASVGAGYSVTASGDESMAVGYGVSATAETAVALGDSSAATGIGSVAIGTGIVASAPIAFGLGYYAKATNDHTFVWSDDSLGNTLGQGSSTNRTFTVRAANGIRLLGGPISGNVANVTNLGPSAIRATNAPVNGYALRYTNGNFYWAP